MSRKRTEDEAMQAFWSRVDKSGGPNACWTWSGPRFQGGYGEFGLNCKARRAHRLAYEFTYGPIPDGLCVLHTCDNPPCCNPLHLGIGTQQENMRDMAAKGRGARGEKNGSRRHPERRARGENCGSRKLTEDQVLEIRQRHHAGESTPALGRRFGVSHSTIQRAATRKTWSHV